MRYVLRLAGKVLLWWLLLDLAVSAAALLFFFGVLPLLGNGK